MSIKSLFGGSQMVVDTKVDDAARAGWLLKRGQVNISLQRRYVLLHGTSADGCVTYFDSIEAANQGKANGQANVASVGHAQAADAPELEPEQLARAFRFDSTESKRIVLVASSIPEKIEWMRALDKSGLGGVRVQKTLEEQLKPFLADEELGLPAAGWAGTARGVALLKQGNVEGGRVEFERVVSEAAQGNAADGNDDVTKWAVVYAQFELGMMCSSKRGWQAALALYEPALEHAPDQCTRQVALQLAWCKWQLGLIDDAEKIYAEQLDADPFSWQ
eukprot:2946585-Prymnesium_polylepis.1